MCNLYNLKGKTAWITGAKRIGQKTAEVLAQHGANIVLSYKNSRKEAEIAQNNVKKFGAKALVVKADVTSRKSIANAVSKIKKQFKKIDILILMASIFEKKEISKLTEEDFKKNFDVHLLGAFLPIQLSLSIMPKGSHIITVSDKMSIGKIYAGYLPYAIAKESVAFMTKALAAELGKKGIFINSIMAGPILKTKGLSNAYWHKIRKASIINYPISDEEAVEEFAKIVLYLSTARSTGFVYPLDLGH